MESINDSSTTKSGSNITAPTQFLETNNERYAYRHFGHGSRPPLLFLQHFTGTLDNWDPAVTDPLAAGREVTLFDNVGIGRSSGTVPATVAGMAQHALAFLDGLGLSTCDVLGFSLGGMVAQQMAQDRPGVGGSTGETPSTVAAMTKDCVDFCRALNLKTIDVLGLSLGGMIAQQLVLEYPDMVRRVILLGTGPQGGEGMTFDELSLDELKDPVALLMNSFFTASESSKVAGNEYLQRLNLRSSDRDTPIAMKSTGAQLEAIRKWGTVPEKDRYATLAKIRQPILVVHGQKDIVVIPINAFLLEQHLANAQLLMYPDASHAAHSQYADAFLAYAQQFLSA